MPFGTKLRELREKTGMTQGQLAEKASMSKGSVSNLEQGFRKTPNWETLQKLATALGVAMDAFAEPAADLPQQGRGRPRKAETPAKPAKPAKKKKK